ncbi:MAG: MBL fold metallo-hydrolase, partial [Armatimonadota bacterium]|nr:MBL fold metallo-hydrolase [Armatimonadota bacterium]
MQEIAPGVVWLPVSFANVYLVSTSGTSWVLVDTGLPGRGEQIRAAAEECFGEGTKPAAIVLTHGHFDHAGSALELATLWDVPVYAHRLAIPFLTGKAQYPPPAPTVGGFLAFV